MKKNMLSLVALAVLVGAIGLDGPRWADAQVCAPAQPCGDMNNSGTVTASDALKVLKKSVGLTVDLQCGCNEVPPSVRFVDNGDGTVTDNSTGLMWEKKSTDPGSGTDFSNPHDVDNYYTWSAGTTAPIGTAFTDFLDKLNGQAGIGFAGHWDWRLPTREELQGILELSRPECGLGGRCIDPVFGPTQSNFYWSFTTYEQTWLPFVVLMGMTLALLVTLMVVLKRRDPV